MKWPKVSIIYVNYKNGKDLVESIKSVIKSRPKIKHEIIIVDNSPKDLISKELGKLSNKIVYLKSSRNIGYGAGNNLGASRASGEYLFILNPDTLVNKSTIETLTRFLDRNIETAAVAPNLVNENGEIFENVGARVLTPWRAIFSLTIVEKIFPNNKFKKEYRLNDIPKDKLREVEAVPGSAFMIRKNVFKKMEGFDEKMFMYFEEADLGKRIKDAGYKLFIEPKARVVHKWLREKSKAKKFKKYFAESRFYYFKKHFGLLKALVVEFFARVTKTHLLLAGIVFFGFLLRIYKLEERMIFGGELGHNYLAVKNFIVQKQIPLLGPPTSHPWLYFGPLFYWLIAPVLVVGSYDPVFVSYFFAAIFSLVIILNFFVVEKIFDKPTALISSLFVAISPTWLQMTRGSRFFSLSVVMFYPFYYFLYKSLQKKEKHLFWAGFFYGLMLNFHLSGIILLPAILVSFFIKRKYFSSLGYLKAFGGFAIANLPFLVYNALHKFEMIGRFIVWVPYRIAGFLGFYPKNTADTEIIKANLHSFYYFITNMFGGTTPTLGFLIFVIFALKLIFLLRSRSLHRNLNAWLLLMFLLFGYISVFVHGDPPRHYYMPLYPVLVILVSYLISLFLRQNKFRNIGILVTIFLATTSLAPLFQNNWYKTKGQTNNGSVAYEIKKQIVEYIVDDSDSAAFSLQRVGINDHFEGNYAQDYQYLMWLYGNEPVRVGDVVVDFNKTPQIGYTIYENIDSLSDELRNEVFMVGDVGVFREEVK